MTIHTITAFFDDRRHADEAVMMLGQLGVSGADVTLSPTDARDEFATFDPLDRAGAPRRKGFWGMLEDFFGGSDDHELYAEGVRRGSTMLTANVDDERLDQAVDILDRQGSIDLDERQVSWRNDGWLGGIGTPARAEVPDGADVVPPPVAPAPVIMPASFAVSSPVEAPVDLPASAMTPQPTAPAFPDVKPGPVDRREGDVVQVFEERLVVGKRAVSRGKVRVHSFMVEQPVSEQIQLRDETISVERRAIDREVSIEGPGHAEFRDRTIEIEEVDEEAVVSKTARLVEEIGLHKDVSNRVELIRDTVRSTKVDIEDGRDALVGHTRVNEVEPEAPVGSASSQRNEPS